MKKRLSFICAAIAFFSFAASAVTAQQLDKKYAPIEVVTPARPAGQQDVIGLTAPKLKTVRIGVIGLGMRGIGVIERWVHLPGVEIKAICDLVPKNIERAQNELVKGKFPKAAVYTGSEDAWKKLCERKDIDLVYIATDWKHHAQMGVYAMEHGKHAAIEVPAAMTLDEIWQLINTSERTRKHCMQLENCVYDFFEMTTLNMAQHGLFGDILHVEGSLVAMDTKAVTGPELAKKYGVDDHSKPFQNGDHTMTFIRTENGKTIQIQHDVMNPRPYSRMYQLTGTDGFANKYPIEQYCFRPKQLKDSEVPNLENLNMHAAVPENVKEALMKQYKHPITKMLEEEAKKVGGHGGMDYIMDYRLVYCLHNGLPLDMDVYDLAEWCCMAELTRLSIENGNAPVAVPDFTRGGWKKLNGFHHAMAE